MDFMSGNLRAGSGLQRGNMGGRTKRLPAPANIIISFPVSLTKQDLLMELCLQV